jgi:DNA-binding HxlR family transcriptional regulator
MKLHQTTLEEHLPTGQAGTTGKPIKFVQLGGCKFWILRQLSDRGPMTAYQLKAELPVTARSPGGQVMTRWSENSVSARLTEMAAAGLVRAKYVGDEYSLTHSITALGRKAIRGEPV